MAEQTVPPTCYVPARELPPYAYVPGHGLPHPVNDPGGHLYATRDSVHEPHISSAALAVLPREPLRPGCALVGRNHDRQAMPPSRDHRILETRSRPRTTRVPSEETVPPATAPAKSGCTFTASTSRTRTNVKARDRETLPATSV